MEETKTYLDWVPILEKEEDCLVWDADGERFLRQRGMIDNLMTKEDAREYFMLNTCKWQAVKAVEGK